ncbi:MAG: permease [Candidatus Aminicenantes bacterium]|nr:permease [Candidatus Aminicenantes bacterium]
MDLKEEYKPLLIISGVFLIAFFLPLGLPRFDTAILEALHLAKWYAREHVLLCLIPAFFIAGAISVFISQGTVMKYLGPQAKRLIAFPVAAVSGSILAVCSCTILPLFAGIHKRGAGLGPASTFLYSGPAINILAIILTTRILGVELGIARAVGAVAFSVIIGLLMEFFFRKDEAKRKEAAAAVPLPENERPVGQTVVYFALMVFILVFANWGKPQESAGLWHLIYSGKWWITAASALLLAAVLVRRFKYSALKMGLVAGITAVAAIFFGHEPMIPFTLGFIGLTWAANSANDEGEEWISSTWGYTKQILPLLFFGVLAAGFLLGRPGQEGMLPSGWIASLVGGNSIFANFFASIVGAFMYFATLTEVPILQGLMANGMGKGPALALLLAGPALSLPNMLVIRSVLGTKKTVVFVCLVVVMATMSGIIYGTLF